MPARASRNTEPTPSFNDLMGSEPEKPTETVNLPENDETKKSDETNKNEGDNVKVEAPENDPGDNTKPVVPDETTTPPSVLMNKTPSELAAETPDETAARYDIDTSITDDDAENPNVQVYKDTTMKQVPSGTHLHPDIAKDLSNRGISENTTDSAQVTRTVSNEYAFAPDAEYNDKMPWTYENK